MKPLFTYILCTVVLCCDIVGDNDKGRAPIQRGGQQQKYSLSSHDGCPAGATSRLLKLPVSKPTGIKLKTKKT